MTVRIVCERHEDHISKQVVCDKCGATLSYLPDDVREGHLGEKVIKCPKCDKEVLVL